MSEQKPIDNPPGKFDMSLRVLGNELIGFKLEVDDLKQKWITVGIIAVAVLGFTIAEVAPPIVDLFIN